MAKKLDESLENSIESILGEESISKKSKKTSAKKEKKTSKKASVGKAELKEDIILEEETTIQPSIAEEIENDEVLDPAIQTISDTEIVTPVKEAKEKKKKRTLHLNINFGKEIKTEEAIPEKPVKAAVEVTTAVIENPVVAKPKKAKKIDTSVNQNSAFFYEPSVFEKFNLSVLDIDDTSIGLDANSLNTVTAETTENTTVPAEESATENVESKEQKKNAMAKNKLSIEASIDKELYDKIVEKTSSKKSTQTNKGSFINQNSAFFYEPSVFEKFNLKISGINEESNPVKIKAQPSSSSTNDSGSNDADNSTILNEILEIINSNKDLDDFSNIIDTEPEKSATSKPINIKVADNNDYNFNMDSVKKFVENRVEEILADDVTNILKVPHAQANIEEPAIPASTINTLANTIENAFIHDDTNTANSPIVQADTSKDIKNIPFEKKEFNSPVFKKFSYEDTKVSELDSPTPITFEQQSAVPSINNIIKENASASQLPVTNIDNVIPEINVAAETPIVDIPAVNVQPLENTAVFENIGNDVENLENIITNTVAVPYIDDEIIDKILEEAEIEIKGSEIENENNDDNNTNIVNDETVEDLLSKILTSDKNDVDESLKNTLLSEITAAEEELEGSLPPIKDFSNLEDCANSDFVEAIEYISKTIDKLEQDGNDDDKK